MVLLTRTKKRGSRGVVTGIGNGDTKSESSNCREEIEGKGDLKKEPLVVAGGGNAEDRLGGTDSVG